MLAQWVELGLSPNEFWGQTFGTYQAAMLGAMRARKAAAEQARDLALMTAYFGGQMAVMFRFVPKKVPSWPDWLDQHTKPRAPISAADRFAAFAALADQGFDVTVSETIN